MYPNFLLTFSKRLLATFNKNKCDNSGGPEKDITSYEKLSAYKKANNQKVFCNLPITNSPAPHINPKEYSTPNN